MMNASQQHILTLEKMFSVAPDSLPIQYEILSRHGKPMTTKRTSMTGAKELGFCFRNAVSMMNTQYSYCEGYAVALGLFPMEHAWVVDESDGQVVDPTWANGTDYFGVKFTRKFAAEFVLRVGHYGIFSNLYLLHMSREEVVAYLEGGIAK
jgi:hypothetical protein